MTTDTRPGTTWRTIPHRIRAWAEQEPDRVCLREKRFGVWQGIPWREYWENVRIVAHGLAALGVGPGDRVAIHSENRPEWLYTDVGCVAIRAISVGLYSTNPPAEVAYLLRDSGARVLIAEDQEQVDKALAVEEQCPDLQWIVYLEPRGVRAYDHPKLLSWEAFLEAGRAHRDGDPTLLDRLADEVSGDDVVTLIYTSGTTGPPKGAMLTVANVEFAIDQLVTGGGFYNPPASEDDVILSYLPLCHVAERIFTTWFNASTGVQVNFAESIETVQANLAEIQPTVLFAVPRIWEKVLAGIHIKLASASPAKRLTAKACLKLADRIGDTLVATGGNHTAATRALYALGWPILFRPLRDRRAEVVGHP
jgi:long-chain acyl-CoA synthetase